MFRSVSGVSVRHVNWHVRLPRDTHMMATAVLCRWERFTPPLPLDIRISAHFCTVASIWTVIETASKMLDIVGNLPSIF